jgi:hypothetical protein
MNLKALKLITLNKAIPFYIFAPNTDIDCWLDEDEERSNSLVFCYITGYNYPNDCSKDLIIEPKND